MNNSIDNPLYLFISVAVMALVTYLVRMIPLAAFRKKITSKFLMNFLYYVPYAVLAAMTVPSVFYADKIFSVGLVAGFVVAVVLAFFERGLLTVAVCACAGVFLTELIMKLF